LSIHEAAIRLGVSGARVRKLAGAGRIPGAKRHGKSWRIPAEAFAAYAPQPVGRPHNVAPPEVSREELQALTTAATTYWEWWRLVEQHAPSMDEQLSDTPVKSEAQMKAATGRNLALDTNGDPYGGHIKTVDGESYDHSQSPRVLRAKWGAAKLPPGGNQGGQQDHLTIAQKKALSADVAAARARFLKFEF